MKQLKIWTLLSLLTLLLAVACSGGNSTAPEATAPANNPTPANETAPPEPTIAPATAVPSTTRTTRLTPAATPQLEQVEPTLAGTNIVGEVPEEIMTAVYEDLITTENISKEAITVTKAESIIWNDGSLGCPQPDQAYAHVTVPGYWIVLEANGRTYDYHAAENGYFILCQNSLPAPPPIVGTPIS